jgi:two-component system, cell cycle sensor histidine kinase and response regulator CckA
MFSKHVARGVIAGARNDETDDRRPMPPSPPSVSVLIVDDDAAYVDFIRSVFEESKAQRFELVHVTRLSQVLPALASGHISVVLLDVNLPDGNGLEWLRANRSRVQAAVIVLTGFAEFDSSEETAPGAQDFLLKNEVDPHHLVRAVRYAADRERVRQQLIRSREYFQSLIEQARDLITVVDDRGVVLYQSPSSALVLGLAPDAVVDHSMFDFVVEQDVVRARELLAAAFDGDVEASRGGFTLRHERGGTRTLDVVASRIPSVGGSRRVVLNSRDVTERLHATEALRERDNQLRQAQKMEAVGRLAGGIAHDFSNVLTVITGACERLQDRVGSVPGAAADIETILRNSDRAASMTRQLLAFSRQQTLAPQPLDLAALVRKATHLLKRLIGEHIELTLDIPQQIFPVEADPTQLDQVLMNLAINARDAMGDGGSLRISMRMETVDELFAANHPPMTSGEFVLVEVTDTGTGMTPETKARAFDPFFTTKDPAHGTGLGLSTVYGIIKQSGGYIWIDSELGRGTTFRIFLPLTTAKLVQAEVPKAAARGPMKAVTILLAEDEEDVRTLLSELLEAHGHRVLAASSPAEALVVSGAYRGNIDLLLTDVVMPGGTGRELARQLLGRRPGLKVLYISGYPEHGTSPGKVLEAGVPFLPKPFTRDLLLAKLKEILG